MLSEQRQRLRYLLNEKSPADALEAYYAIHHPDARTSLVTWPADAQRAAGFVAVSRTGIDLFRPLVTMRLPRSSPLELDLEAGVELLHAALQPEAPVLVHTSSQNMPLIRTLFHIDRKQSLRLLQFDQRQFEPVINIYVTRADTPDGEPRFIIRNPPGDPGGTILASAGVNWVSPLFADVAVRTQPVARRQGYGRSVLSSLVQYLSHKGKSPIYFVDDENKASQALAEAVGFRDTLARSVFFEGHLLPRASATGRE